LETAGKSSQRSLSCYEASYARQFRKSALPPQADIADPNKHVRYGPESAIEPDLTLALAKPRFR